MKEFELQKKYNWELANKEIQENPESDINGNTVYGDKAYTSIAYNDNSVFGYKAAENANLFYSTVIGASAVINGLNVSSSTVIGNNAAQSANQVNSSIVIGTSTLANPGTEADQSVIIGNSAAVAATTQNSVIIGFEAGQTSGYNNVIIGKSANAPGISGSIVLGAGAVSTASNQFVVGSSGNNAGTVTTETLTSTKTWSVRINGVDYKILLA